MGGTISRVQVDKYNKKRRKIGRGSILIIGLDNAGKSTVVGQLIHDKFVATQPTMGHQKETLSHWGQKWDLFDVGGSVLVRETWRLYSQAADGLIVVVDSSDEDRMNEMQYQLRRLYFGDDNNSKKAIMNAPLLVLANKQDKADAIPYAKIEKRLDLAQIPTKKLVLPSNACTGENIMAGFMWLSETVNNQKAANA